MSGKDFYSGLLSAIIVVNIFDQPTIIDEIMGTLGDKDVNGLISFAVENEEYELSGLKQWDENRRALLSVVDTKEQQ